MKKGKEAVEALLNNEIDNNDRLVIELRIGNAIRERGLTQKELAEKAGIRPAAISQLARGYIERLNIEHLEKIANALQITDINELITINVESEVNGIGYENEQQKIIEETL